MKFKCIKCHSENIVKNGIVSGWQRYKCKDCGYQFTKLAPAGKPIFLKLIVHHLYVAGLSMRKIAGITGVTAQSISRWIKKWHQAYMSEIGKHETLYYTSRENLDACLNIQDNDDLLISSMELPSGAKFNIVIQLPPKSKNH